MQQSALKAQLLARTSENHSLFLQNHIINEPCRAYFHCKRHHCRLRNCVDILQGLYVTNFDIVYASIFFALK